MNNNGFLVLDTNIWVYSTRLLSTPLGASVIYSLRQMNKKLALPEVIEQEIKKHTCKKGNEAVAAIETNYRLIEQLMGSRDDYQVPTSDQFVTRVDSRLTELGELIHKTDFTLNHAKSAMRRVLEESPPNSYKNQQFKDSVIWESIIELGNMCDVDFVTEDKGFFQDSKPQNGLASNLAEDCKSVSGKIRVFYEVSNYLKEIKEELPAFDREKVVMKINESIIDRLAERAVDKGYKFGDIGKSTVQAFLTEKPEFIAIEFEISYSTSEVLIPDSGVITEATLFVKGNCGYNITNYEVTDVQFDRIYMLSKDGENIPSYDNVFLRGSFTHSGRRVIPYRLKEPLH